MLHYNDDNKSNLRNNKNRLMAEAMPAEVKQRMEEIEAEFADKSSAVAENTSALEATIKQAVIENGTSVKATVLHAVFAKGRVTWDSNLDGYAVGHPELLSFRKEGKPSVSLRKI